MILISHRGNVDGRLESSENNPEYIDLAIKSGYDVEIDVWCDEKGVFWLGHDKPEHQVEFRWFRDRVSKLWIHCKNINAVTFFHGNFKYYPFNYFWHQEDDVTLTSKNYIWAYPGKQPIQKSIAVMPERNNDDVSLCQGICSDYISKYKNYE